MPGKGTVVEGPFVAEIMYHFVDTSENPGILQQLRLIVYPSFHYRYQVVVPVLYVYIYICVYIYIYIREVYENSHWQQEKF